MTNKNGKKDSKKTILPCGAFCEDGYCGDCVFLNYGKQGSSGQTYYCTQLDTFRKPTDFSNHYCSHFRHR